MDESALLKSARKLDETALATIFDVYAPAVYRYCLRLCQNPVESDNLVGEVFSRLLDDLAADNDPVTNLRFYLYQMAYQLVVDRARHNKRTADIEDGMDTSGDLVSASSQSQIEEHVLIDALVSALKNNLSELQQHVIILRFLEGFSLHETAAMISTDVNQVKVIQNRGIARLRKSLQIHVEKDKS